MAKTFRFIRVEKIEVSPKIKKNLEIKRFNVKFDRKGRTFGEGNNDTFIKTLKGILEHLFGSIKMLPKSF